jgi:hypothetical protein
MTETERKKRFSYALRQREWFRRHCETLAKLKAKWEVRHYYGRYFRRWAALVEEYSIQNAGTLCQTNPNKGTNN